MTTDDVLDAEIRPFHEALAARLALALVDQDPDRFDAVMREIAAGGCAIPVCAVTSRNLVATLVAAHDDLDIARKILELTIIDADGAGGA